MNVSSAINDRVFLSFYRQITDSVIAQVERPYQLDDSNAAVWLDRLTARLNFQLREEP